jgi:hypothetical protein
MAVPAFLTNDEFVSVEAHIDSPDSGLLAEDRESVGDFTVYYDDVPAHEYEDLVEESTGFIETFPGVQRAVHEDREMILGWGEGVDLPLLHRGLIKWWRAKF